MELKLQCNCGQKYKFDVEPVNGQMPFTVACPVCGVDGTPAANGALAEMFPQPAVKRVSLSVSAPAPAAPPMISASPEPVAAGQATLATPGSVAVQRAVQAARSKAARKGGWPEFNWGLGILGAFLGAGLGAVLLIGFVLIVGFRLPFTGMILGALTGGGARLFFRGVHGTLGLIAAVLTGLTVFGCFILFYGLIGTFMSLGSVVSLFVSIAVAYRLASQ